MIRLTEEHVPGFIYLMDQIIKYDLDSISESIYITIAEKGKHLDNKVHPRTISRAFNLRENLKKGEIIKHDYNLPKIETLNVLTAYHFEQKIKRFRLFEKKYEEPILSYYNSHEPPNDILKTIFKKQPVKINHIQKQEDTLVELLNELNGISLEDFVKFWVDESLRQKNKDLDLNNVILELKGYIDQRINEIVKKKRKTSFLYRLFGSFGLFFVSIDYREMSKESILDDFFNDYDILLTEDDSVLEDLI